MIRQNSQSIKKIRKHLFNKKTKKKTKNRLKKENYPVF